MATCCQQERDLCRSFMQSKESTKQIKIPTAILEIIPRRLQGKIPDVRPVQGSAYIIDVLWGQPIKLVQVASTSELHENQRNDLVFFKINPSHFCRASELLRSLKN